jgi:hypothetical protein
VLVFHYIQYPLPDPQHQRVPSRLQIAAWGNHPQPGFGLISESIALDPHGRSGVRICLILRFATVIFTDTRPLLDGLMILIYRL